VLICHCFGVNETRIRELARRGQASLSQVLRSCRAGADCGGCHPAIRQILAAERERCSLRPKLETAQSAFDTEQSAFEAGDREPASDQPAA